MIPLFTITSVIVYEPANVNPGTPRHMTRVHQITQGTLWQQQYYRTSFWHHPVITNVRNIDFWEGIQRVKANGRVGIPTDKPFLHQNFLGQPGGPHISQIDIIM